MPSLCWFRSAMCLFLTDEDILWSPCGIVYYVNISSVSLVSWLCPGRSTHWKQTGSWDVPNKSLPTKTLRWHSQATSQPTLCVIKRNFHLSIEYYRSIRRPSLYFCINMYLHICVSCLSMVLWRYLCCQQAFMQILIGWQGCVFSCIPGNFVIIPGDISSAGFLKAFRQMFFQCVIVQIVQV